MGGILCAPVRSQLLLRKGSGAYRIGGAQMQGYRTAMEDAHSVQLPPSLGPNHPEASFVGVYDGHSGDKVAKMLSASLHRRIAQLDSLDDEEALQEAVVRFDQAVGDTQFAGNGSTCVFCIVRPRPPPDGATAAAAEERKWDVTCANVGDSRAMLIRRDGTLLSLTTDHKPEATAERRRIERAGGFVSQDRVDGQLAMSRAMGDWMYKRGSGGPLEQKVIALPDVTRCIAEQGDRLLVICDGVVERMGNMDVAQFVHKVHQGPLLEDPARVCEQLLEYSLRRGSTDNHSAVLWHFADGTGYARRDEFVAGPFAAWSGDRAFARAYIENARSWGVSEKELHELAREADRRAPPLKRQSPRGGGGGQWVKWVIACYVVWILYRWWEQMQRSGNDDRRRAGSGVSL